MASVIFAGDGGIVENLAREACEAEEPMIGDLLHPRVSRGLVRALEPFNFLRTDIIRNSQFQETSRVDLEYQHNH